MIMTDCLITENTASTVDGGGIQAESSTVSIYNSILSLNSAYAKGGAIVTSVTASNPSPAKLTVVGSKFTSNNVVEQGGAVFVAQDTTADFHDVEFTANSVIGDGFSGYYGGGALTSLTFINYETNLFGCSFDGNTDGSGTARDIKDGTDGVSGTVTVHSDCLESYWWTGQKGDALDTSGIVLGTAFSYSCLPTCSPGEARAPSGDMACSGCPSGSR